jgi:acetamidase/formamidase
VTTTAGRRTHELGPDIGNLHFDFSREREPVLWIDPGDVVRVRTLDAAGFLAKRRSDDVEVPRVERDAVGHTLCGPIGIRGAKPGQALEIELISIRPGDWGWTGAGGWESELNTRLGVADQPWELLIWTIDADAGTATDERGNVVKLRPFMGVLGMPPDEPGSHPTAPPRPCGGNLDCKELVAGSRLYLPITVEGALFSIGDGHGVQGDGEVSGMAIECPMEHVEIRLSIVDEPRELRMPRALTDEGWLTFGLHERIDEAIAIAIDEMLGLLEERGFARKEALALASLVVDVRITQLVNGVVGAHCVLPTDAIGSRA